MDNDELELALLVDLDGESSGDELFDKCRTPPSVVTAAMKAAKAAKAAEGAKAVEAKPSPDGAPQGATTVPGAGATSKTKPRKDDDRFDPFEYKWLKPVHFWWCACARDDWWPCYEIPHWHGALLESLGREIGDDKTELVSDKDGTTHKAIVFLTPNKTVNWCGVCEAQRLNYCSSRPCACVLLCPVVLLSSDVVEVGQLRQLTADTRDMWMKKRLSKKQKSKKRAAAKVAYKVR